MTLIDRGPTGSEGDPGRRKQTDKEARGKRGAEGSKTRGLHGVRGRGAEWFCLRVWVVMGWDGYGPSQEQWVCRLWRRRRVAELSIIQDVPVLRPLWYHWFAQPSARPCRWVKARASKGKWPRPEQVLLLYLYPFPGQARPSSPLFLFSLSSFLAQAQWLSAESTSARPRLWTWLELYGAGAQPGQRALPSFLLFSERRPSEVSQGL